MMCQLLYVESVYYVQGEANLKFVFFVMRQLDQSIPSISSVKRFILPGLTSPTQVGKHFGYFLSSFFICHLFLQCFTEAGIPFYINSSKAILNLPQKWLGIPLFPMTVFGKL